MSKIQRTNFNLCMRAAYICLLMVFLFGCEGKYVLRVKKKSILNSSQKLESKDCIDTPPEQVSKGIKYTNCSGEIQIGIYTDEKCITSGQQNCVVEGDFFAGKLNDISSVDIRAGVNVGGIIGTSIDYQKARASYCRSGFNSSFYNSDVMPPAGTGAVGAQLDWWDTVTDATPAQPPSNSNTVWSDRYYCDGNTFSEVTNSATWLSPDGAFLPCLATCTSAATRPFTRIFFESTTGLYITNTLASVSGVGATWSDAVEGCFSLSSGDGANKWRVPTQKEMQLLSVLGIVYRNMDFFNGDIGYSLHIWTATQNSLFSSAYVILGEEVGAFSRTSQNGVICVR